MEAPKQLAHDRHDRRATTKPDRRAIVANNETSLPRLIDIPTLAESLGVTARHVRRLVDERRIPSLRVGRLVRFDPAEVASWLEDARVPYRGSS